MPITAKNWSGQGQCHEVFEREYGERSELKLRELLLSHGQAAGADAAPTAVVEEFTPSDDELDSLSLSDDI